MQNEGVRCRRGKQKLQCGCWATPGIGFEPVPLPHTDGRADGKGEEGIPISDYVCRRHCTVRWKGSYMTVLGDAEEGSGRGGGGGGGGVGGGVGWGWGGGGGGGGGGASKSIENPVHGLFLRKHTTSVDRWSWRGSLKCDALRMLCDEYRGGRRYGD